MPVSPTKPWLGSAATTLRVSATAHRQGFPAPLQSLPDQPRKPAAAETPPATMQLDTAAGSLHAKALEQCGASAAHSPTERHRKKPRAQAHKYFVVEI